MKINDVIAKEIETNAYRVAHDLTALKKDLSSAMREYVESVSKINRVIGIYCGLDRLTVNLLDIIESDSHLIGDFEIQDKIIEAELTMARKYESFHINHITVGSARKTLDQLEKGDEVFGFFMDDQYSGKEVKRIYPLS